MAIVTWPGLPSDWWVELDLPTEWTPFSHARGEFLKALDAHNKHLKEAETPLDEEGLLKRFFWQPWTTAGHYWLWDGTDWIDLPSEEEAPPPPAIEFAVRRGQEEFKPLYWSPLAPLPFTGPLAFDFSRLLDPVEGNPGYVLHVRINPDLAQAFGTAAPNMDPQRAPGDPLTVAPIDSETPPANRRSIIERRVDLLRQCEARASEPFRNANDAFKRAIDDAKRAIEDARTRGDKEDLRVLTEELRILTRAYSTGAKGDTWRRFKARK